MSPYPKNTVFRKRERGPNLQQIPISLTKEQRARAREVMKAVRDGMDPVVAIVKYGLKID